MKKLNILLTIVIATLFVACSNASLEGEAKKRLKHIESLFAEKIKVFKIERTEVLFSSDSICVMQCHVKGENFSGDVAPSILEYYIMWTSEKEPKLIENFYFLFKGDKSVLDRAYEFSDFKLPTDKKEKAKSLRIIIPGLDALKWREVKDED